MSLDFLVDLVITADELLNSVLFEHGEHITFGVECAGIDVHVD